MTSPFPFQSGQVLTAAQMNDITNLPINDQTASYTLVVGDAGKRVVMNVATANTVTVNDTVFTTGDTIFVANKGAGAATLTAGAGVTINSASGLVLVANQSGQLVALSASSFLFVLSAGPAPVGGLELISTTTIGTTVSTVTVTGAFSATFENYFVLISGGVASTSIEIRMTVGSTTTGYGRHQVLGAYNANTLAVDNANFDATSVTVAQGTTNGLSGFVHVLQPFAAKATSFYGVSQNLIASAAFGVRTFTGALLDTTSRTAFTLTTSAGTMTGGTIRVYGYKD